MNRFEGKTYVVTGGGSGIGRATAKRLLDEGANVAVVDLVKAAAQETINEAGEGANRAICYELDVSISQDVDAVFSDTATWFGGVDGVVNSAGIRGVGSILDTSHELWDRNMAVNLTGAFNICQSFCRYAVENGRKGAVVNISSQAGIEGVPNRLAYVASKHGVIGLTRAVALDVAGKGVRVNAIAPGTIRTPMTSGMLSDAVNAERIHKVHPIGRVGEPEEIAAAAVFLLSEDASFITGAVFSVDGGMTTGLSSF